MNQGKLDMGKQEMARVNINILGISELQCKGMGEFNSYDHCIYYCGQESLRRNGVALIVTFYFCWTSLVCTALVSLLPPFPFPLSSLIRLEMPFVLGI